MAPRLVSVDYDPFQTRIAGKAQDRMPRGPVNNWETQPDVSRNAPQLGATPVLSPRLLPMPQPRLVPVEYDPFDTAMLGIP